MIVSMGDAKRCVRESYHVPGDYPVTVRGHEWTPMSEPLPENGLYVFANNKSAAVAFTGPPFDLDFYFAPTHWLKLEYPQ